MTMAYFGFILEQTKDLNGVIGVIFTTYAITPIARLLCYFVDAVHTPGTVQWSSLVDEIGQNHQKPKTVINTRM